ncbi:rhomboid family intramembrane serine protease [Halobacillus litoralis]|uniref:rhomboid family intramembrane serine protease n=1 Tax=Halobacillus litoralis TaxID=45668 RepID=UPI001CFCF3C8|nr:rhomboid family intramembrane serine protease [Halobacillus litoralis]
MFIKQEYYLWKMTYNLVAAHDFQVLHMNTSHGEVWLEKEHGWKTHVVRLKHKQINWKNELRRDLEKTYKQLTQNRKLFRGGKVQLHTLYISEHNPVEEWEDVVENLSTKKTPVHVYYMSDSLKEEEHNRFYRVFDMEESEIHTDMEESEMESILPYMKHQLVKKQQDQRKRVMSLFDYGKPRITYVLLALNILIFMYIEWKGDTTSVLTLIDYGAKYNPAIVEGEWWRILTSMFLHIGMIHLFMNMLALFYLGVAVERIYGSGRFFFIYMLAGLFGGLASFMLNPHVAAGASGAIFGLFGALIFFGIQYKQLFFRTLGWNLIFIILLNISFGLLVPQVDNGAHIGGLIGGFLASAFIQMPKHKIGKMQAGAFVLYLLAFGAMAYIGFTGWLNGEQTYSQVQETQELNQRGDYDRVIEQTTTSLENPGIYEAELLFNRSYAYVKTGRSKKAKEDLESVVSIAPEMAEAHYNLALLYQEEGQVKKAAEHAATAVSLKPENEEFQKLKRELRQ